MFDAQDYQAEIESFQRKTEQEHIIDWVEREVVKSITPQLVCMNYVRASLQVGQTRDLAADRICWLNLRALATGLVFFEIF